MAWYEDEYKIKNIVRDMSPPVGMRTDYYPGQGGSLGKDLSTTVGQERSLRPPSAVNVAPGEEQSRLNTLEYNYPTGYGTTSSMTTSALPVSEATPPDVNRMTGVADEWKMKFDDTIRALTEPNENSGMLRNMAQGYGLPMGAMGRKGQVLAAQALKDIEINRKTALSHLANTMANLMMKPGEMQKDIWGKQLEYDLGRRRTGVAEQALAWEKEKFPIEMGQKAPTTAVGVDEEGNKQLFSWNKEGGKWDVLSKGKALPIDLKEDERLVDPYTGKVLTEAKGGGKTGGKLSELAFREYMQELKRIEDKYGLSELGSPKKTAEMKAQRATEEQNAYKTMTQRLSQFGHPQFAGGAVGKLPNREDFHRKVQAMYPDATPDQIDYEYMRAYGGR